MCRESDSCSLGKIEELTLMKKINTPTSSKNFLNLKKRDESELLASLPKAYELESREDLLDWEEQCRVGGTDYFDFKEKTNSNKDTCGEDDDDYAKSFKSMLIKESAISRLKSHSIHLATNKHH
jgi:hypothetical protein